MDTTIGRFISMDSYLGSVDDPVSLHKYLYANANPVNYIDPSGYNSYGEMNLALKIQLILTDITTLKINMYCWYIRLGEASIGGKILKEVIDESFELLLEGDVDIYSIMWTGVEVVYGLANSEQEFSTLKKINKSGKYSIGDATFMDANDAFVKNISHRTDVDVNGYFDVIAHGAPNGIQITHNGQHMIVDHRTAARLIQNSEGYNGQAIRLLSCNTGSLDNGFAQNLANKLNVKVYAPTNYLWATPNGNYFVAGMNNSRLPDMNDVGTFKLFSPGGI